MIGLTYLEVQNSIFNITEQNNKFELHKLPDEKTGGVSYEKVRDEIERDLDVSDTTATDLQDDIIGPIIIEECRKQVTKRMEDVGYTNILQGYIRSIFQDFESYLRTEVDFVEVDIRLVLDEFNSSLNIYELTPGFYTFIYLSETLFNILQTEIPGPSKVIDKEFDDLTRKTKLVVREGIIAIKFDERSFLVLFGFYFRLGL